MKKNENDPRRDEEAWQDYLAECRMLDEGCGCFQPAPQSPADPPEAPRCSDSGLIALLFAGFGRSVLLINLLFMVVLVAQMWLA